MVVEIDCQSAASFLGGKFCSQLRYIFALTLFDNKRNLKNFSAFKFTEYVFKIYVVLNVVNEQNEEEEETNSSKVCLFKYDQLVFLENELAKLH